MFGRSCFAACLELWRKQHTLADAPNPSEVAYFMFYRKSKNLPDSIIP